MSTDDLDKMFAQARSTPPEPSAAFLARVLHDAQAEQPQPAALEPVRGRSRAQRLREAVQTIGGWPALAGLASAAVTGLWIGISPPESLITPLDAAFGETALLEDTSSFGSAFDFTQFEG